MHRLLSPIPNTLLELESLASHFPQTPWLILSPHPYFRRESITLHPSTILSKPCIPRYTVGPTKKLCIDLVLLFTTSSTHFPPRRNAIYTQPHRIVFTDQSSHHSRTSFYLYYPLLFVLCCSKGVWLSPSPSRIKAFFPKIHDRKKTR